MYGSHAAAAPSGFAHVLTHPHTHIYTRTPTQTHTHTRTHTHTHTLSLSLCGLGAQALTRVVDGSRGRAPVSAAELLVAMHRLEPTAIGVPLPRIMDGAYTCPLT
jgi:hypothetical protein